MSIAVSCCSLIKVRDALGIIIKYIPFPEHLKGKYQTYTCAKKEWDYKFTTIKEYLQV